MRPGLTYFPCMWDLAIRFLIYGALGWCLEVVFTGVCAIIWERDRAATGKTYLWMHPIYGLTALLLEFVHGALAAQSWLLRGLVYVLIIYAAEYSSGWLLKRLLGRCPWDYSGKGLNLSGLIRLDYAPAWFVAGLLFEPIRGLLGALLSSEDVRRLAASTMFHS